MIYDDFQQSCSGLVSILVLLMLSLLSLFSVSLFRTGLNSLYVIRNERALLESFCKAQEIAMQMANKVFSIDDESFVSEISRSSNELYWLKTESEIDFNQISSPIYWEQLNAFYFPPYGQGLAIFLNAIQIKTPSESLVMTHDTTIKSYRFSILAKAEVSGGIAIVETGISRRIAR
jgi:hypothetical protein